MAATDGSIAFARWCQFALLRGHTGATNWLSRAQITEECRYTLQRSPVPLKLPFPWGSGPHLTRDSLGPSEPTKQTASRSVQPFLHRWLHSVPMLYNGTPLFPLKVAPSHGGIWTPSNTWFPGPTRVLNPNGITIGSAACFCRVD